ncbi:ATP-binding cassette domain-containing protein [Candidatus Solincola sp.]|nr:ABC transporter ATP-binding protein [Actinomycetota bacterium]MDI7252697.1 ABC transporter ATP-binding protein [Actinomycetota bacterium]
MEDEIRISAENITYSYDGWPAVDHISFQARKGEILGFLGPNGAGKTTTLKMLVGLLVPQDGRITILGRDIVKERAAVQARIGVCFEEKSLYEDMSAAANLKFFASLFGVRDLDVAGLLQRVGLPADRKDQVSNYSKGMKQRLMVARALVNDPLVLFLDEPTDGLDPVSSEAIREVILEEKERGVTVFLTTHDMVEADKLSDRVAFINEGRIAALDTPDNLKHEYGKRVLKVRYRDGEELREEEIPLEDEGSGRRIQEILRDYRVLDMHTEEATLEDIFIMLTGKKLE